jgi:hypothetical protein
LGELKSRNGKLFVPFVTPETAEYTLQLLHGWMNAWVGECINVLVGRRIDVGTEDDVGGNAEETNIFAVFFFVKNRVKSIDYCFGFVEFSLGDPYVTKRVTNS